MLSWVFNALGPPEPALHVTLVAVAAEKAKISWIVGLSGGSKLSFQVLFSVEGASEKEFVDVDIIAAIFGVLKMFLLQILGIRVDLLQRTPTPAPAPNSL